MAGSSPPPGRRFTRQDDPDVDARIRRDLDHIARVLVKRHPEVETLILGGSFGRGEGTVMVGGGEIRPLNDYDLVVIRRGTLTVEELQPTLGQLAWDLGFDHLDADVLDREALLRVTGGMFYSDLKHGGFVFHGEQDLLDRMAPLRPESLGVEDARILLFNRLTCPLEKITGPDLVTGPPPERLTGMVYMAHKVVLAGADALLTVRGLHHPGLGIRAERFREAGIGGPAVVALVEEATREKLFPSPRPHPDPVGLWFRSRDFYMQTLWELLPRFHQRAFADWPDFARHHRGRRLRDTLRKLRFHFTDPTKETDIRVGQVRRDIELTEIFLVLAAQPGGRIEPRHFGSARRLLTGLEEEPTDWEQARAMAVRLDRRHLHPVGP